MNKLYQALTIVTAAGQRLRRILARRTSDAAAIAGHRGVGKTTVIRAVTPGLFGDPDALPPLPLIVAAPARHDARDFVLYLHAMLCKQVITRTRSLRAEPQVAGHQPFVAPQPRRVRAGACFERGQLVARPETASA